MGSTRWSRGARDVLLPEQVQHAGRRGRGPAGPRSAMPVPERHVVNGAPLAPPFPEAWSRPCSGWAASGAPSASSGRRRACTPPPSATPAAHANPTYEEVCSRPDRPHRGRAGRVRPGQGLATRSCSRSSGRTTTRPRACARATTSAPSTARRSTPTTRPSRGRPRPRATPTRSCSPRRATAPSPPRSREAPDFYYAEDYHQQYLAKNPGGYCGIGGTGVSCPVGLTSSG